MECGSGLLGEMVVAGDVPDGERGFCTELWSAPGILDDRMRLLLGMILIFGFTAIVILLLAAAFDALDQLFKD